MKFQRRFIIGLLGVLLCGGSGVAFAQSDAQGNDEQAMPKPWGVGLSYYQQSQPYGIESLELSGLPPAVAGLIDPKQISASNFTETTHVTFDYWVLPFLDLQLLAGTITSNTDVQLSKVNIGMPLQDLHVRSKGNVYGGGITLVYGYEQVFGTLTAQYTSSNLDELDSSVKAYVLTPKIGMKLGTQAAAYLGAMYQKPQEKHTGTYLVPPFPAPLHYSVTLTNENKWGYLAGVNYGFTENWVLTVEGGFGKRKSVLAHLDYRW